MTATDVRSGSELRQVPTPTLEAFYSRPTRPAAWLPGFGVFEREVRRFFKVPVQTLCAPVGSACLYFIVFKFSIGRLVSQGGAGSELSLGLHYVAFLVPGVMALESINASFQNPVSSIMISKWSGSITDQLQAPLGPVATWLAYLAGAAVRVLVVALSTLLAGWIFAGTALGLPNLALLVFATAVSACVFGSLGILAGVLCRDFDQVGMIGTFVLQPLTFLSGVFFSFQSLPESIRWLPQLNPAFYVVNLFRHAVVGRADLPLAHALAGGVALSALMGFFALRVVRSGKGIRS